MKYLMILLLSTVLCKPAVGITLEGGVVKSTGEGRVGIKINYSSGFIEEVYRHSPAKLAGVRYGDKVLLVDGKKNYCDHIHGEPGTYVHLQILRKKEIVEFNLERVERWKIKSI